ncbi:GNAT family N-acetyltransferase [Noviherbaspirillum cavernae]
MLTICEVPCLPGPSGQESRLLAHIGGVPAGAIDFSISGEAIQLHAVYVKPQFRGQGIGKALVQSVQRRHPSCTMHPHASKPKTPCVSGER